MRKWPSRVVSAGLLFAVIGAVGCGGVPTSGGASIYSAAESGDMGALREMLRKGFDVNTPDDSGMTLLHHAAAGNQPDVIEMLMNDYPAKADVVDKEGRTALDVAVSMGNEDAAVALESEG
ncbi:MAG: ankyrin repeat domain-containing protein [Candidatus Hydrogenedentes bacterium]|nr:ankyrin repeat domain-containing protein [Candidatus Hydrogenedentota bacterium]